MCDSSIAHWLTGWLAFSFCWFIIPLGMLIHTCNNVTSYRIDITLVIIPCPLCRSARQSFSIKKCFFLCRNLFLEVYLFRLRYNNNLLHTWKKEEFSNKCCAVQVSIDITLECISHISRNNIEGVTSAWESSADYVRAAAADTTCYPV